MSSTLFFAGRVTATPNAFSIVDASGLEVVGLGGKGIVAVIGTSEGGVPITTSLLPQNIQVANRPEDVRSLFKSGDLREAGAMLYDSSSDPNILGTPVQVLFLKTKQA